MNTTLIVACECGKVAVVESPAKDANAPVKWTEARPGVCPECYRFDCFLAKALGHLPGINPFPSTQGGMAQGRLHKPAPAGSTPAPAPSREAEAKAA